MAITEQELVALTPLEYYTHVKRMMLAFQCEHAGVIGEWGDLTASVVAAENELKAWARDNGPCENDSFAVTVTQKARKWYDADKIVELAPYVKGIPGVVVQSIDRLKVETLAQHGMIDAAICQQAYHEEAMTPAVSIRPKL